MSFLKKCRYLLEGLSYTSVCAILKWLPLKWAAPLGSFLARTIGPCFKASRIAHANLTRAFPEWNEVQRDKALQGMWDNFGRILPEYFHPKSFMDTPDNARIEVVGQEVLEQLKKHQGPVMFVSAHYGNWQLATLVMKRFGFPVWQFYRPPNNPYIHASMRRAQASFVDGMIPKDSHSLKRLIEALRAQKNIVIFFDQYMHKGTPVPFFNEDALTAPVSVRLAQKMGVPLVPFYVMRLKKSRFRVTFEYPVSLEKDEFSLLKHLNERLECWIRKAPEQWFWVHNRWKRT